MAKNVFEPSQYFGNYIIVKTSEGNNFEGELYCYDETATFCVIKKDNDNGTANFYIIRCSLIVDVEIKKGKISYDPLSIIDKKIVDKIEKRAISDFKKNEARIGIGVTKEAQELFDFIWKTHPDCVWHNKDILVLNGEVSIKPPYGPNNCTAKNEKLKERFSTVISKFRRKRILTNKE